MRKAEFYMIVGHPSSHLTGASAFFKSMLLNPQQLEPSQVRNSFQCTTWCQHTSVPHYGIKILHHFLSSHAVIIHPYINTFETYYHNYHDNNMTVNSKIAIILQ